jgi:hypothetical protein
MDGYTAKPDDGGELVSSEAVAEQAESRSSIFKVWDLGVSFSDDDKDEIELIKDLKRLIRDNPRKLRINTSR